MLIRKGMFSKKSPRYKRRIAHREGFTIVEMIVTIGIVLTLALLLFQGYGRVMGASQKSKCVANLRAIGGAEILYVADNDGWFVPNRAELPGIGTVFWCQELLPYLSSGNRVAFPKVGESKVLVCPGAKGPSSSDINGYESTYIAKLSYAQNIYLGGGLNTEAYGYPARQKLASVSKPSRMVLVAEASRVNARSELFDVPLGSGAAYRHNKEMNLLFVDGHIESSQYPVTSEAGNSIFNWRIEDEKK